MRLIEAGIASEKLFRWGWGVGELVNIKHYILLPSGEEWVYKELWDRETFLFCYE